MTKNPKKSGANIPEARRHTVQLKLRVAPNVVEQLDALRGDSGRSEYVSLLLAAKTKRRK